MDLIKRFFGLSSNNQYNNYHDEDDNLNYRTFEQPNENAHRKGFHIFSDPLQMHQYFEHQMNEMLKMFGFQGFDNDLFSQHFDFPSLEEEISGNENYSQEQLRNQFLKNGYEKPPKKNFEKIDKDIDGRMNIGDLDSVFGSKNNPKSPGTGNKFFGHSKTVKTIKNADGSFETHCIIRDNEGNEEVTVCRKIEDKEYCMIKKKDKYGKEEVIENLVNIDENEKDKFMKSMKDTPKIENKPNLNFPFDIFFK